MASVSESVAMAPGVVSPPPQPIEVRPAIGWPPAIPYVALASPMPAQSNVSATTLVWL